MKGRDVMKQRMPAKRCDLLDVRKILEEWDPFAALNITRKQVDRAIAKEQYEPEYEDEIRTTKYHTRRIAYFVKHGWDDPISVDVGCGHYGGHFEIVDGNHRLCAAVIRGDACIKADTAGMVSIIKEYEWRL